MKQAVLFLLSFCVTCCVGKRKLIFIAGPHRSEANSVIKFFHDHAQGKGSGKLSNGLDGWVWPEVKQDLPGEKHRYFENFFSNHQNETIRSVLLESIKETWSSAKHGVIIGAEGFDNTRGDSNSLGLKTMQEIISKVGINADQVHVVNAYRSPRIDQWLSFYENSETSYEDFVCNRPYTEHIINIPMNPFMLANIYRGEGYDVSTVDLSGVRKLELDPAHAVACKVLPNTNCQDGWVEKLEGKISGEYEAVNTTVRGDISFDQQKALESLFRDRDCSYQHLLEGDDGFAVIHQDSIWKSCNQYISEAYMYTPLSDPNVFFNMVKAMSGCQETEDEAFIEDDIDMTIDDTSDDTGFRLDLLFVFIGLSVIVFAYQAMGKHMRRKTHYVRSPKSGEDVWIDFGDDGQNSPNLRTNSSEDDEAFTDVDLQSPRLSSPAFKFSERLKAKRENRDPRITAAIQEGKSVRGLYRVGLYQDSPNAKTRPHQDDSRFEHTIKSLEQEFS